MYYIYQLRDSESHTPFYIGKGRWESRMYDHFTDAKRPRSKQENRFKCAAIAATLKRGNKVVCEKLIEFEHEADALAYEAALILSYGRMVDGTGCLTNIQPGGEQPPTQPKKTVHAFDSTGTLIKTYESTFSAAQELGVTVSVVQNCCAGRSKVCKGHALSYDPQMSATEIKRRFNKQVQLRTVYQYCNDDLIATHISLRDAAIAAHTTSQRLSQAIHNGRRHKGFYWRV